MTEIIRVTVHTISVLRRIDSSFDVGMDFELPQDILGGTGTTFFHVPQCEFGSFYYRLLWILDAESAAFIEGPRPCRIRCNPITREIEGMAQKESGAVWFDMRPYQAYHGRA